MEHKCLSPWKGSVIGGVIVFAWSAISWMALPFHNKTVHEFNEAMPVVAAVQAAAPASGVYILHNDPEGQRAPTDPFLFLSYYKPGWGSMGVTMLVGFLLQCIGAFYWTWILGKIPGLTSRDAALYGCFFGVCLGVLGFLPNSNWWKFPWTFSFLYMADAVIAWTIASVAIARFGQAAVCSLPQD